MLRLFSSILCMIMVVIGVLGYSFEIPNKYVGDERVCTSLLVYYASLSAYLLVYALYNSIKCVQLYVFLILFQCFLSLISAYGLYQASTRWSSKLEKVTEILLYLSVIYLLGKTPPFDEFGNKLISELTAIPILASVAIILFTAFVILKFEQRNTPFLFEDFDLVSITFVITSLIGLGCIGNGVALISFTLITLLDFYVLSRIVKVAKSVM